MESLKRKAELLTVKEIKSMYGADTHIVVLEQCQEYQASVKTENCVIGSAGQFDGKSAIQAYASELCQSCTLATDTFHTNCNN